MISQRLWRKRDSPEKYLGIRIARICETSGGAFLKIGQILGTRYNLFSEETIIPLQRLQDDTRPLDSAKIKEIIESNLKRKSEEIFSAFDLQPVASASIAQVHRARLRANNSDVAIKVLRPNIKRQYEDDLLLINFAVKNLKNLPGVKEIPLAESFNQIADCLLSQTDFLTEADNNRKFQAGFSSQSSVKFPCVFEEFCTAEVLVMEFFKDLKKVGDLSTEESENLVIEGLKALYRMIFIEGFIHCDLHQSNFFQFEKDCLAILDTGFVAEIDNKIQASFREFFMSVVFKNASVCSHVIKNSALRYKKNFDHSGFEAEIAELLRTASRVEAQKFQVSRFVLQLFNIQRKYGIYSTPDFTLPIISLLVYEGTTKKYYPKLDFQKIAVPFLRSSSISKTAA